MPDEEQTRGDRPGVLAGVVNWIHPSPDGTYADCTLGLGGHSEAILTASPGAKVIGIDRDLESLRMTEQRLAPFGDRFKAVHGNFKDLDQILSGTGAATINGCVADLGVSSLQ